MTRKLDEIFHQSVARTCSRPGRKKKGSIIMKANILTTSPSPSGITTFRRRLLRVHGTVLTLVALAAAVATTIARVNGIGPFGFLQQNPMAWVGLIQAY